MYFSEQNSWIQPTVNGSHPASRHGHVMVAIENNLYVHGGMAGTKIFADIWQLKIGTV